MGVERWWITPLGEWFKLRSRCFGFAFSLLFGGCAVEPEPLALRLQAALGRSRRLLGGLGLTLG